MALILCVSKKGSLSVAKYEHYPDVLNKAITGIEMGQFFKNFSKVFYNVQNCLDGTFYNNLQTEPDRTFFPSLKAAINAHLPPEEKKMSDRSDGKETQPNHTVFTEDSIRNPVSSQCLHRGHLNKPNPLTVYWQRPA